MTADSKIDLVVASRDGFPATGVSAVVLNVTAAEALGVGYVTVWPAGVARPTASSLNVTFAGQNIANLVIVPLGVGGSVSLYTQGGTHLVADVAGWFGDSTQPANFSGLFEPLTPARVLDTRRYHHHDTCTGRHGNRARHRRPRRRSSHRLRRSRAQRHRCRVDGARFRHRLAVGQDPTNSVEPRRDGSRSEHPDLVSVSVSATGTVSLYTQSGTHLVADIAGYCIR